MRMPSSSRSMSSSTASRELMTRRNLRLMAEFGNFRNGEFVVIDKNYGFSFLNLGGNLFYYKFFSFEIS